MSVKLQAASEALANCFNYQLEACSLELFPKETS